MPKPKPAPPAPATPTPPPPPLGSAIPDLSLPLSNNFTLKELVRSQTAERDEALKRLQEHPSADVVANLQYIVRATLQPLRDSIAAPLHISSGYRCPIVNKLVGGSATSQHVLGEAADCELLPGFVKEVASAATRDAIRAGVAKITGRPLRPDLDHNGYLFAYVCLHLNDLDVDQVIHEYGDDFGRPAWVHVAASRRQDKREILFVGSYTYGRYIPSTVAEALARCT